MKIEDYKPEEIKIRFSLALVRLLRTYNLFDHNLGYSIRFVEHFSKKQESPAKLSNMSTEQKLDHWLSLIVKTEWTKNTVDLSELEEWASRANASRHIRNRYIHGHWELLPMRWEQPVKLTTPPWWKEKSDTEAIEDMTLDELESVADEMENMHDEFWRIRKKLDV